MFDFKKAAALGAAAVMSVICGTGASDSVAEASPNLSILTGGSQIKTRPDIVTTQMGNDASRHITMNLGKGMSFSKGMVTELTPEMTRKSVFQRVGFDFDGSQAKQEEEALFRSKVDEAFRVSSGRRSPYGSVGCAETVAYAGSYYSPDLRECFESGIASVPSLVENLSSKGYDVIPFNGFAEKGDLLIYGNDDHVTIADGLGGCFGNSSSRMRAMYYENAANAWYTGEMPSKIVKMSSLG